MFLALLILLVIYSVLSIARPIKMQIGSNHANPKIVDIRFIKNIFIICERRRVCLYRASCWPVHMGQIKIEISFLRHLLLQGDAAFSTSFQSPAYSCWCSIFYFISESNLLLPVKELLPLQVRDLFDPSKLPNKEIGLKLLNLAATETTARSYGAIINTFEALEAHDFCHRSTSQTRLYRWRGD